MDAWNSLTIGRTFIRHPRGERKSFNSFYFLLFVDSCGRDVYSHTHTTGIHIARVVCSLDWATIHLVAHARIRVCVCQTGHRRCF